MDNSNNLLYIVVDPLPTVTSAHCSFMPCALLNGHKVSYELVGNDTQVCNYLGCLFPKPVIKTA